MSATTIFAGMAAAGAVTSTGMGIYGMVKGSSAPKMGAPPMPASMYIYDEDGNLSGSQTWNSRTNAYEYQPHLSETQKAEKAKRDALRAQMLTNLGATPADRLEAYRSYADVISKSMHEDVDYQYGKTKQAREEEMASRGMFGSRAYVDTLAELERQKSKADVEIAQQAELGKERLAASDKASWLQTLQALDAEKTASSGLALQQMQGAAQGAERATAGLMAGYSARNLPAMQEWQTDIALNQMRSQNLMNTATGLAFLYGFMGPKNTGETASLTTKGQGKSAFGTWTR